MIAAMKTAVFFALITTCSAFVTPDNPFLRLVGGHRKLQGCNEVCSGQGSCGSGQIQVCHAGEENECIDASEWNEHCTDFGDTCGACGGGGGSGCFSATSTLFVRGKGSVAMKDVEVGDMVMTTSQETFEPLYAFAHRNKGQEATFLKITTDLNSLEVTEEHLVYIAGKTRPVRADSIKVGDELQAGNGLNAVVKEIVSVIKEGLYAPLVPSGQILVDGVLASSYIALQEEDNEYFSTFNGLIKIPHDAVVHFYLSPMRVVCMGMTDKPCRVMASNGMPLYISLCLDALRMAHDSAYAYYAQPLLIVLTFFLAIGFYVVEGLFGAKMGPLIIFTLAVAYSFSRKFTVRNKKSLAN
jgi:Hint module